MYQKEIYVISILLVSCTSMSIVPQQPAGVSNSENSFYSSLNGLNDGVEKSISSVVKEKTAAVLQDFPDSGRKYAILEQKSLESLPIQIDNKYGKVQDFVAGIYNPKPIVDTIQEYEKYGNDGGKHRAVGTAIVDGYETFSNIINAVVELPFTVFRQFGKKVTTSLNSAGGKLVGLY